MKCRLPILALLCGGLWVLAFGAGGQETNAVRFLNPDLQMGWLAPNQDFPVMFMLTNVSEQPVRIAGAEGSCRCVALEKAPDEIPAHGTGELVWDFNTSLTTGKVARAIAVDMAGGQFLVGHFTARVEAPPRAPREGDIVPMPGPRERAYGISGPGAKHTARWTNYNARCTGSAVKEDLIPDLKPLIPNTQLRDTIVILGGDGNYYLTGSSGADIWDFNDGIELWRSPDLERWTYVGEVWSFDRDATWEKNWRWHRKPVRAIWAPEIHYIKRLKNYFITISMPPGNRGILKSTTGKPEGPYVNALANDGYFKGGIDGTLFEDDDGKVYFTSGGASTILLMNDDLSGIVGQPHHVEFEKPADGSWTRSSIAMEGASLFKRDGIYYLGGAAFYQGRYSSVVAMSTNIFGPYKDWEEAVPCGGGGDYFEDKLGNWWCTYFGNDYQSPFREKPAIVKIDFGLGGRIHVAKDQPDFVIQK